MNSCYSEVLTLDTEVRQSPKPQSNSYSLSIGSLHLENSMVVWERAFHLCRSFGLPLPEREIDWSNMTVLLRRQIRYFSLFTLLVDTSGRPIPSFITLLVSLTVTPVLYHGSLTNNVVIVPFHSLFNVIIDAACNSCKYMSGYNWRWLLKVRPPSCRDFVVWVLAS
jgi:hypothetical protein